jgi:hypothetical protein
MVLIEYKIDCFFFPSLEVDHLESSHIVLDLCFFQEEGFFFSICLQLYLTREIHPVFVPKYFIHIFLENVIHMDPKFSRSHFVKPSFSSRLNQVLACLDLTSHIWRYCFTDDCIFDFLRLKVFTAGGFSVFYVIMVDFSHKKSE